MSRDIDATLQIFAKSRLCITYSLFIVLYSDLKEGLAQRHGLDPSATLSRSRSRKRVRFSLGAEGWMSISGKCLISKRGGGYARAIITIILFCKLLLVMQIINLYIYMVYIVVL